MAFIGDIKKMYHTVKTTVLDQHTHRFLWRDMVTNKVPDTYVIQRVSFGDKPSATIAMMALRKTAEMRSEQYPDAAQIVKHNTYMDDIIESTTDLPAAQKLMQDIEALIIKGGFKLKEWIFSRDSSNSKKSLPNKSNIAIEKVLGVNWDPINDHLCFSEKLNFFSTRKRREPKATFKNATQEITSKDVETAELFWIKEAQRNMKNDIKHGTYKRLCPRLRDDGIYVISGRAEKWLEIGYNKEDIILLPYHHRFARLYCEHIHAKGHHRVLTTASKIHARFWITKLLKMIQSVKLNCVTCKKLDKKLSGQVMGNPKE